MLGVRVPPGLPISARRSSCEFHGCRLKAFGVEPMRDFFERVGKWFRDIIDFLKDTRKELNNVSWPGRREVTGTTLVVIAAVFFFGFFLFVVDLIVNNGMNYIFRALSVRP
jgi:preprotein translocase subunit SecE